jgi:hypothetical protein
MNEGPPACPIPRWTLLKQELHNVAPAEFDALRAKAPTGTLLDVRAPTEFDAYHLDGAVNMNYLSRTNGSPKPRNRIPRLLPQRPPLRQSMYPDAQRRH